MNTIEIKHKITGETLYTAIAKDGETLTVRSAIYMASDPARWENEPLPDFYCSNSEALTDMKRMAEEGCAS